MYWAARPALHFCQLAQYGKTLMQLNGNTPSSSTRTTSPMSTRRDGHNSHQRGQRYESFRAQRGNVLAIVTPVQTSSEIEAESTGTSFQRNVHGAASSAAPHVSHCRVCLARDHTMASCTYTVNAEQLATIREASWKNRRATRLTGSFRSSWQ